MPGHLGLQGDPRCLHRHRRRRPGHPLPGGLRIQPRLGLRPPPGPGGVPLRGETRQARPHPGQPRPRIGPPRRQRLPAQQILPGPGRARLIGRAAPAMIAAASLRSPASVRFASFDAFAPILTPSTASTDSRPSPAAAHTRSTA